MGLSAVFAEVKKSYFARFDRERQWRARFGSATDMTDEHGYCDDKTRTIFVSRRYLRASRDELAVILIHELTHAVLRSASHGAGFMRRLERAAKKADRLKRSALGALLRAHVVEYKNAERVSPATIYATMRDLVGELRPATFEEALKILGADYLDEYLRKCRRLESVYRKEMGLWAPERLE